MNEKLKEFVHKFDVRNNVSKLKCHCKSMSDLSCRNCFSGALLPANNSDKNLIVKWPVKSLLSHQKKNLNKL